jgi:hypothetical protein
MFGRNNVLREIVAQLRDVAALLQRDIEAREAALANLQTFTHQKERTKQQEEHRQTLDRIKQEAEERRAEQAAQHADWLDAMEQQTAVLHRIADRLDQISPQQ